MDKGSISLYGKSCLMITLLRQRTDDSRKFSKHPPREAFHRSDRGHYIFIPNPRSSILPKSLDPSRYRPLGNSPAFSCLPLSLSLRCMTLHQNYSRGDERGSVCDSL
ncbi:hypothetical protein AVEN_138492-1 [Araneus ventricosus]|uniref:Uncharacterized protein n=1 Tax=Araneus ventricosus TaxID=182803 RepID=A0A4Y2CDH5_ARAVE|nr:hypothetical protein AVEN_138492-1 [Araneus ventricosus]